MLLVSGGRKVFAGTGIFVGVMIATVLVLCPPGRPPAASQAPCGPSLHAPCAPLMV